MKDRRARLLGGGGHRQRGHQPAQRLGQQRPIDVGDDPQPPPARWYIEPASGAVGLFTAYRAAFKGCLDLNNQTAAVSMEAAKTECATLQAKAWHRTPTTDEIESCASIAATPANFTGLVNAQNQPITFTNQQKWAYACASVLATAEFLAY